MPSVAPLVTSEEAEIVTPLVVGPVIVGMTSTEAVALLHGRALHAPHLLDQEIASVGLKKLRREKLPGGVIAAALQAYAQLPIERHAVDAEALVVIAERYGLTAYDAAYLYVAEQLTAPVRWVECVRVLAAAAAGAPRFVEIGPGNVLAGLAKRIVSGAETVNLGTAAEVRAFLEAA